MTGKGRQAALLRRVTAQLIDHHGEQLEFTLPGNGKVYRKGCVLTLVRSSEKLVLGSRGKYALVVVFRTRL